MRNRKKSSLRSGAAVVEAAVALPVIFLIILGTVEICNSVFLRQSLKVMAYEGARVATTPDAQTIDIEQQVGLIASSRGVVVQNVVVVPADFADQPIGTFVEVSVEGTSNQVAGIFTTGQFKSSVSMMKNY